MKGVDHIHLHSWQGQRWPWRQVVGVTCAKLQNSTSRVDVRSIGSTLLQVTFEICLAMVEEDDPPHCLCSPHQ